LEFDPQANPRPDLAHECTRAREEHPPPSVARTSWSQRTCNVLSRQGFPAAHFADLWAGYGNGATCVRCSEAIKSDHVEYELRFRQGVAITSIQLHRECWEIWWRE
jgi:hypothetical protein